MHKALNERSKGMSDEDWENLNEEAIEIIKMYLSINGASIVTSETNVVKLMEALTKRYQKPSTNNEVYLLKKYFNMQMTENFFVQSYINEVTTFINQLKFVKIDFIDEIYAIQL